jgi:putative transposase
MGLLLSVIVHAANEHDSKAAFDVNALLKIRFGKFIEIISDGGYLGELIAKTKKAFARIIEIVLRSDDSSKFQVLPKRWVAERTLAWFESYRRLSKNFEFQTDTSEIMIPPAMIRLMLNRVKKKS